MGIAATVGVFDGVHIGHKYLLEQLRMIAKLKAEQTLAITFRQHPAAIFAPYAKPRLLCTLDRKVNLLKQYVDDVYVLDFNAEIASLTARQFALQILKKRLGVTTLMMGYDHSFGSDKIKDIQLYKQICADVGIDVHFCAECKPNEQDTIESCSSSRIRQLIETNNFVHASQLLGYDYYFEGLVTHGYHIGTKMGFPTANIVVKDDLLYPSQGVYAVKAQTADGTLYPAMMNIGMRPTFHQKHAQQSIEVHLFDYSDEHDLYNTILKIYPVWYLRNEMEFKSPEALREQLIKDKATVLNILR